MSFFAEEPTTGRYPLRKSGELTLGPEGITHPRSPGGRGRVLSRYEDVTHLAVSSRALWIGTLGSVYILPRRLFAQTDAPERVARAIAETIGNRPGGGEQLARIAQVERTSLVAGRLRATMSLAVACVVVYVLQMLLWPTLDAVAHLSPPFVLQGDLWRIFTANLLHAVGFPPHLLLNLLALVVLGGFVERPLGTARTIVVMAASGIGAMFATLTGTVPVVGVSGVVFGLVGAVLVIDYRCAADLPAWWRFPRRTLWILLGANAVLSLLPMISAAAHFGGLIAGSLAAMAVTGEAPARRQPQGWVRAAAAVSVGLLVLSVGTVASELSRGDYLARNATRLASVPGISPVELNDWAWIIAIDPGSSETQLEDALALAERAVGETDREDPHSLDTLAELHFQLGRPDRAVEIADEAIALLPDEPYYREQRKRFSGDRPAHDRPPDPVPFWVPQPAPDRPPAPPPEDALTI